MKLARVSDYKRRIRETAGHWPFQLRRFAFEDIPTLGSGEIPLTLPLVVIAGPNGVGKTTILRSLWAAAAPEQVIQDPSTALKLSAGRASLLYFQAGAESESKVTFAAGAVSGRNALDVEVVHVDSAAETKVHQRHFASVGDVNNIINGVGYRELDAKTLNEVNYISRRDYREIKVYEIESDSDVVPFFEVSYGNDRYDSRTMGGGELAILFLWWAIDRVETSAFLLVEEPETYLSPSSQEAFSHFLIGAIVDKNLNVVLTTHSPKIINAIPEDHHIFLFREAGGVRVVEGSPPPVLLGLLGIEPQVDVVILVEDEAAEYFLRQILERHKPSLSRRTEICIRNGDGEIISFLTRMKGAFRSVKIIGVFDGDIRGKTPEGLEHLSAYLPGDEAVEQIFKEIVVSDPAAFEKVSGSPDIGAILFGLQGAEKHDWYAGLGKHLGLSKAQLFPMLFQLWERRAGNNDSAVAVVQSILELTAKR